MLLITKVGQTESEETQLVLPIHISSYIT